MAPHVFFPGNPPFKNDVPPVHDKSILPSPPVPIKPPPPEPLPLDCIASIPSGFCKLPPAKPLPPPPPPYIATVVDEFVLFLKLYLVPDVVNEASKPGKNSNTLLTPGTIPLPAPPPPPATNIILCCVDVVNAPVPLYFVTKDPPPPLDWFFGFCPTTKIILSPAVKLYVVLITAPRPPV